MKDRELCHFPPHDTAEQLENLIDNFHYTAIHIAVGKRFAVENRGKFTILTNTWKTLVFNGKEWNEDTNGVEFARALDEFFAAAPEMKNRGAHIKHHIRSVAILWLKSHLKASCKSEQWLTGNCKLCDRRRQAA